MTRHNMTRKEFLAYVGSFLGLFLLSRLSGVGSSPTKTAKSPGSYGTHPYGGTKNK